MNFHHESSAITNTACVTLRVSSTCIIHGSQSKRARQMNRLLLLLKSFGFCETVFENSCMSSRQVSGARPEPVHRTQEFLGKLTRH